MKQNLTKFFFLIFISFLSLPLYSQEYGFYTGKDFGSEYRFNPLNLLLNGGYDIFQARPDHNMFKVDYKKSSEVVFKNLGSPFKAINYVGWGYFLKSEVFPGTFSSGKAKWPPNYTLHLIGGGMTYAMLVDYYQYYNLPTPRIFAFLTYYSYHLLNEIVENGYNRGRTVDPIADIYIFDLFGILLFTPQSVSHFFSKTLNMTDWSLQPTFTFPDMNLENVGQYFSLKWRPPFDFNKHFHIFAYWGLNILFGLSYKTNNGIAVSIGGGARTRRVFVNDFKRVGKTVTYVYSGGIFLDKDNSLLASFLYNRNYDHLMQLNVYPGFLKIGNISPGFWVSVSPKYRFMVGFVINWLPGIGYTQKRYYQKDILSYYKKLQ